VRESQEGSERIRHIVRDLRDFSHRGSAERTLADVNQCVDTTANIVFTMMKHHVTLEKEYAELPRLRCYPMELKQVFMNLLVNAYQAIEQGIGRDGEAGVIRIVSAQRDGGIVVRITDSGIGIAPEDQSRIFDPFFTTKAVGTGTGLGLSTSYAIVERHGGTMTVESVPGRGSTFEVWLPLEPPDPAADGVGATEPSSP
jgi:two-component system NtrC family sensor kinase